MWGSLNPSQYKRIDSTTGSVSVAAGQHNMTGLLCAQSGTGIIEIWDTATDDSAAGAQLVVDAITLVAGQPEPIPAKFNLGIYIKKISGTYKATVFFD